MPKDPVSVGAVSSTVMRTPAEIEAAAEAAGSTKATLPIGRLLILALLAGCFIALGGAFMLVVKADLSLPFAVSQVLGGLVFCLGLFLVLVAGAELFTGNCLMVAGVLSGRYPLSGMLRNWVVVYAGNACGALVMAGLLSAAAITAIGDGALGGAALSVAASKASLAPAVAFARGILCNMLVCLAVWMGFAGKTVCDKLAATILPVCGFVALGFEHSVANLFFLPFGLLIQAGMGETLVPLGGVAMNLVCVTAGNIVGGVLVGAVYWFAYAKREPA